MHAAAMLEATPAAVSELETLVAALLRADPGARVLELQPGRIRLRMGESAKSFAVLVQAASAGELTAAVEAAIAAGEKGTLLRIIAVDPTAALPLDALKASVEAARKARERTAVSVLLYASPSNIQVAAASKWPVLEVAARQLGSEGISDPRAIIAERQARGGDADAFLARLNTRQPVVTWAVAAVSVALFGLQMLWGNGEPFASGMRMGASVPTLIMSGQVWRLLAPMTLHGNFVHLLMNMVALFSFGTLLERFLGSRRYLLLYVLSGLGGGIATQLRPTEVVSVGASGGIWGLMLAGAVLVTWPQGRLPELVSAAQRKRAWTPVLINGFYALQPGIDLLAHLGGGIVGALLMFPLLRGLPPADAADDATLPPAREKPLVTVLAAVSGALVLAAVAISIVTGRPWELTSRPTLMPTAVGDTGVTISLPALVGPAGVEGKGEYVFGDLSYDPLAFVVVPAATKASPEELADPKGALQGVVEQLNAPGSTVESLIPEFSRAQQFKVVEKDGRLYAHGAQAAPDGRRADTYYLFRGERLIVVMVLSMKAASPGWHQAAAEVPFTVAVR